MRSNSIDDGSGLQPRFDYFVLRIVRATSRPGEPVRGTVERLGSQQKHAFAGSAELLQLLGMELMDDAGGG